MRCSPLMMFSHVAILPISKLWYSRDAAEWNRALERYWQFVQPANLELEHAMEHLEKDRIRNLDADGWFRFLHDEYFRWKYTAPNRYATTTASLRRKCSNSAGRAKLNGIRGKLLALDASGIASALETASQIPGLGTAGASGLLALLHPTLFGTVDQFAVKALRRVPHLTEAELILRMKPEALTTANAVVLIEIMRRKAKSLSDDFGAAWTPRAVDKVLWTYGRA